MSSPAHHQSPFEGHPLPNFTPVPNVFFDEVITGLSGNEIKALCYIYRRTFGFQRFSDSISFNQFLTGITTQDGRVLDKGCGITNRTRLSEALKSLETKGIIAVHRSTTEKGDANTTIYTPKFKEGVVPPRYYPSAGSVPPVVPPRYLQDKGLQNKGVQDSNTSKDARPENRQGPHGAVADDGHTPLTVRTSKTEVLDPHSSAGPRIAAEPQRLDNGMPTPIGDVLKARTPKRPRRKRTEYLDRVIEDFSGELGDAEHVPSNLAQARTLFQRMAAKTGIDEKGFVDYVYRARAETRQVANVRKKMAYFFAVLRDLLQLSEDDHPLLLSEEDLDASLDVRPIDPPMGGSG